MLGQPLDFAPGTRYAYSNFGYCVLGRIIEKITGQTYEAFVKKTILESPCIAPPMPSGRYSPRRTPTAQTINDAEFFPRSARFPLPNPPGPL